MATQGTVEKMTDTVGQEEKLATILVVDDEIGPRESLKLILEPNYTVVTANNGKEALDCFESSVLDMVITDIRMPVMTGVDLMKAVKERFPDLPVILITGYGTLQTAQEAVRAGAFDYINKPYDVEDIRNVVARALAEARKRQENSHAVSRLTDMNRQLEGQIQELNQRASIGELSAEMIHDLNNPISVLRGYIALLEDSLIKHEDTPIEEKQEFLDIIKEQIERCMRLTRNFLDYARNSRRNWDQDSINGVIEDALFVLRVRVRAQDISLETKFQEGLPKIWLQPAPLQQVFYNLVSNAVEAMEDQDRDKHLALATRLIPAQYTEEEDTIEITVRDNGPGIPHDQMEQIFAPFFSTKEKDKGTGLGLAICKRIVEEHNGSITLESRPGQGTCAHILLPVLSEKPEQQVDSQ